VPAVRGDRLWLLRLAITGPKGLPGTRRSRPRHETPAATDLVERMFTRDTPNRLWVNDISEHHTYEGGESHPPTQGRITTDRQTGPPQRHLDRTGGHPRGTDRVNPLRRRIARRRRTPRPWT